MFSPIYPQSADELRQMAESRGGGEITPDINRGLMDVVHRCSSFFSINAKVFGYPNCGTRACAAGILVDVDRIKIKAIEVERKLLELEQQDKAHRIFDPCSLIWYAVAHEFAHCLQATKTSWEDMKSNPLPHEVSADYVAGVFIGCRVADLDINFLSVVDTAWEIGRKRDDDPHPLPSQRHAAVSLGVQIGACYCCDKPTSEQLGFVLERSYRIADEILKESGA